MKKSLICLPTALLMSLSALADTHSYSVRLDNPLDVARADCPIEIDLFNISPELNIVRAVLTDGDTEIPCQIDDFDGDGAADCLAFVIDMAPKQSRTLSLALSDEGTQPQYEPRVWAGFMLRGPKKDQKVDIREVTVPGHVDFYNSVYGHGPMFESELVGYRVYFNQKQTLDPYGKFHKGLELAETLFYPTDKHIAEGYGDDVLTAGNSLGVGAFKGWNGSKAVHIEPVKSRTERVLAYGPVRVIVEVEVDDWDYQGKKVDMVNRYYLYAGHRDLKIDACFRNPLGEERFSTGVERILGNETISWSDHDGLIASWGRWYPVTDTVKFAKETIGIATYVPKKYIVEETEDPDNFLYVLSAPGEDQISYYTMFTSRKEDFGYTDSDAWFAYLPSWRRDLENPVLVTVSKD